jgi:hypothetical protein
MRYFAIGALTLALSGCAGIPLPSPQQVCAAEEWAHLIYINGGAKLLGRSEAAQQREARFYAKVKALCDAGASPAQTQTAASKAQNARQQP